MYTFVSIKLCTLTILFIRLVFPEFCSFSASATPVLYFSSLCSRASRTVAGAGGGPGFEVGGLGVGPTSACGTAWVPAGCGASPNVVVGLTAGPPENCMDQ